MIRYYPKNRIITNQVTTGGEFTIKGEEYRGSYYKTFDGKFFTGSDPFDSNANVKLTPIETASNLSVSTGKFDLDAVLSYEQIKNVSLAQGEPDTDAYGVVLKELTPYYPQPTQEDYERGYFLRYFAKKVNESSNIIEISKENYDTMRNRKSRLQDYLYQVIDLFWKLTGPLKDDRVNKQYPVAGIIDTNKRLVETKDKTFPGLKTYIGEEYSKFAVPSKS